MSTYLTMVSFTHQGIEEIEEGPQRLEELKGLFNALNGEMKDFYLTLGPFDAVIVSEFASDEAAARAALAIGQTIDATTQTLKAFTEDQYRQLVRDIP